MHQHARSCWTRWRSDESNGLEPCAHDPNWCTLLLGLELLAAALMVCKLMAVDSLPSARQRQLVVS